MQYLAIPVSAILGKSCTVQCFENPTQGNTCQILYRATLGNSVHGNTWQILYSAILGKFFTDQCFANPVQGNICQILYRATLDKFCTWQYLANPVLVQYLSYPLQCNALQILYRQYLPILYSAVLGKFFTVQCFTNPVQAILAKSCTGQHLPNPNSASINYP